MKQSKKQTKRTTFADLVADSEPQTTEVQIGDHKVTIREMTGRERFELSDLPDGSKWDTLTYVAFTGLVDPRPETIEEMDGLKTEWVVSVANAVLNISGMSNDADEEAENESASVIEIGGS